MKKVYKESAKKSGIYKITNLVDGKFYIGSTKCFKQRAYDHEKSSSNKHLKSAFEKHGFENFIFEVIEVFAGSREQLFELEQKYLDQVNDWESCYNFLKKSQQKDRSCFSKTPEETKKLISENSKKMWGNQEHRELVSKKSKKRWEEDENYREKCLKNLRVPMTEEYRKKLSEDMKNKWKNEDFRKARAEKISATLKNKMQNDPDFKQATLKNLDKRGIRN